MTVNGLPAITAPATRDDRHRPGDGDRRRQPVGERQHRRRDLHGDAERHPWPAVGDRRRTVGRRRPTLTISRLADESNADLATLTDTDADAGSDTITLNASDSFGNSAAAQTIAVTVNGLASAQMSAEIQMLRTLDPGVVIPGIDTHTGNPLPTSKLTSWTTLTTNPNAPVFYSATDHAVVVKGNNVVLNGYNFSGTDIMVWGNDCTIENSTFNDQGSGRQRRPGGHGLRHDSRGLHLQWRR